MLRSKTLCEPSPEKANVLTILITIVWVAAVVLVAGICRAAASGDQIPRDLRLKLVAALRAPQGLPSERGAQEISREQRS